jgi:hypothetical protein
MTVNKVRFSFPNGEVKESPIVIDSYSSQEIFHNNLKAADGSCNFKIPFDVDISNLFQSEINLGKVKVEIQDAEGHNINTYYCKDSVQIEKTQKNQPLSIQAVSPSFFLDETLKRNVVIIGNTVGLVIRKLLAEIEFTNIGTIDIPYVLNVFTAEEGKALKDIINTLLYEYGYVSYFDENGNFNTRPLFDDLPQDVTGITQTFDGTNSREKIVIKAKPHEADYVAANYEKVDYFQDTLLFSDTQNADNNNKCLIEIQPYYCIFESTDERNKRIAQNETSKENFLDYDSTLGGVRYVSGIRADVIFDDGMEYTLSRFDNYGGDLIDQACLKAYNPTAASLYCRKLDIYGDAWIATESNTVVSSTGTKSKEVTLQYVHDKSVAERFALNVANYYRYANFDITVKSYDDYELGSCVKVTDYGIGTYYGRIVSKKRTLKNDCIEYQIETLTDYIPAVIEKSKNKRNGTNAAGVIRGEKGDKGDPGTNSESIFVYLEQSSTNFCIDNDGKVEGITVEIPAHVICDGEEFPFKIGELEQKPGLNIEEYYKSNGEHGIRISTIENYLLENGSFDVPIIYTTVKEIHIFGDKGIDEAYGNEDDRLAYGTFIFDDESVTTYNLVFTYATARLALYRGAKNTISGFLTPGTTVNLHRGDWFTWTGQDTSETYNGVPVSFVTARVYKWNGNYWVLDDDPEHQIVALSDVISVTQDQLVQNNTEITQLLTRLTNAETFYQGLNDNDDFVRLLAANQGFFNTLVANTAYIDSITSSEDFTDKLVANNAFVQKLTTDSAFISYLVAQQAFIEAIFAKTVSISSNGWIQSEGYDGQSTGFRLNGNGTFECVNGIFNGAIDSGPLKLNRSSSGSCTISNGSGTSYYVMYETLVNNGIMPGTHIVSGTFNGVSTTGITFSASTSSEVLNYNHITYDGWYPENWQNPNSNYYHAWLLDLYYGERVTTSLSFTVNGVTYTGTRVVTTWSKSTSWTAKGDRQSGWYDNAPTNSTVDSGYTSGATNMTFGATSSTLRLVNLPTAKLSAFPAGTVYVENGYLKIV